jgi:F-type H+-transporting ATPase subunit b
MLIDWFTVVAQAVNFLILVWLLRRFLYRPVLAAIEAREKKIAAQLEDAAARQAQARKEGENFRSQSDAFDRQREELLRKATDEANAARQRLLDTARKDADMLRSKLAAAVTSEREVLNQQIVARTREEVFAIARKTLADLAGTSLEERMTEVFLDHLRQLCDERRTAPAAAAARTAARTTLAGSAVAPAFVRSVFELSPARRATIEVSVKVCLGEDVTVRFETSADPVTGIELTWDGRKIAWSVADYLTSLSKNVAALLEPEAATVQVLATEAEHAI